MPTSKKVFPALNAPGCRPKQGCYGDDCEQNKPPERRPQRRLEAELGGPGFREVDPLVSHPDDKRGSEDGEEDGGPLEKLGRGC